jgi:hypothetical protein
MRGAVVAVMLIVALLIGAGGGYLFRASNEPFSSSVSTTTVPAITLTETSLSSVLLTSTLTTTTTRILPVTSGIGLLASTNGTAFKVGQEVAVTAILFNPSGQSYNVTTVAQYPFNGLLMFNQNWAPCYYYSPVEILVLKGNFTASGVMATVSSIGPNPATSLGCMENEDFRSFRFEPTSSLAFVAFNYSGTGSQVSVAGPQNASARVSTNGYWDNSTSLTYPASYASYGNYSYITAPHQFVKGIYTVAVGDEWGQLVVIHITVE